MKAVGQRRFVQVALAKSTEGLVFAHADAPIWWDRVFADQMLVPHPCTRILAPRACVPARCTATGSWRCTAAGSCLAPACQLLCLFPQRVEAYAPGVLAHVRGARIH